MSDENHPVPRRPHPEDDWSPPSPLPQRPPYGYQFIEGSWSQYRSRPAEPRPGAGLRYIRSLYQAATERRARRRPHPDDAELGSRETLAERADRDLARVQEIGASHEHVGPGGERVLAHREPVTGCPWCVDCERAAELYERLLARHPHESGSLRLADARVLCARGDLARERAQ